MSDNKETTETTPAAADQMMAFADLIAKGVASGIAAQTRRKVTNGEYEAIKTSPFHPFGVARAPKLKRACFQNGFPLLSTTLHDAEIEALNKITRSGRYIDRMVEVILNDEGIDETIDIRFKCRLPDDRMVLSQHVRNFREMLNQIIQEQDAQDAEFLTEPAAKARRHFGDNKAYREARERAGLV